MHSVTALTLGKGAAWRKMVSVIVLPSSFPSLRPKYKAYNGTVNMTRLRVYRRAYYAAIAYTDYNIGVILNTLESLELDKSTVVVCFGDHGYQLGEHDTWAKMTNFELGVHIPLIIRAPWMRASLGRETAVLAEMVDIYPTLSALAGRRSPTYCYAPHESLSLSLPLGLTLCSVF